MALSCSCLGPTPLATCCNNMARCVGERVKIKTQAFIGDVRGTCTINSVHEQEYNII